MKNLMTIFCAAVSAVLFVSCEDKGGKSKLLDPMAKISIKPSKSPAGTASKAEYLSPVEVVRLTTDIVLISPIYPNEPYTNFGISDEQKDFTTPKIMMWGMWVIENNAISRDFIEAKDVIFVTRQNQDKTKPISDTLAYIPNATLRAAEIAIKAAYAAGDLDQVYDLFDKAYQFTPINGADWLKLKAEGRN